MDKVSSFTGLKQSSSTGGRRYRHGINQRLNQADAYNTAPAIIYYILYRARASYSLFSKLLNHSAILKTEYQNKAHQSTYCSHKRE